MDGLGRVRSAILWLLWLALVVIWVGTLAAHWSGAETRPVYLACVALGLLVVLFFAEGIELAVTSLLDVPPERLADAATAGELREIQQRVRFFFAQRQVFVVIIITFTSLITSYNWLSVPFVGRVAGFWPFYFSLVFTSLTVLWFCQVTPKQLAIINPERFLRHSRFTWSLI
ncbi:MAG TPA: hypothetical protein VKU60_11360, partial [Chloroflexota bacterium]|nr:hypothetical protein [Chloroflexota bacterium]